jgi:hypothetical protein
MTPLPSAATTPPAAPMKHLPRDVAQLLAQTNVAMTRGTFAAIYNLSQSGRNEVRSSRLVEKGTRYRFEHDPDPGLHEVIINDGKQVHQCQRTGGAPMKCTITSDAVLDQETFGAEHPSMLMSQIESMNVLVGRGMKASTARPTLLGMPLRCVLFQATFAGA